MRAAAPRESAPFIHPDDMPDMYALTGVGTCLAPLIEDGACCVFDKRQEPQSGDIVGIIFTEEARERRCMPGWIKRLVIAPPPPGFDGLMMVEQINPPRNYWIETRDLLAVHKFVGIAESNGAGKASFRLPNAADETVAN